MSASRGLRLYNTLTRTKQDFAPIDPDNVRMYVCGPTVYDFAHIGNARPVIVFDVLFRLLRHLYGEDHVTYVRNITDVDDKINARAARDYPGLPLNEAIRKVTEETNAQFQEDVKALGCLEPTYQPRATDFVEPRPDGRADMITLIQRLIERGHAYEAAGEVLFDTASMPDYGQLSKRNLDEQQAGARVAVDAHKRNPGDFVLWKLSSPDEPGWDSPWGRGRPGWHIECSAMSAAYLGEVFDIHGGGLDLIFPHHENEIAQSRCAHGTDVMANVWMHNGFLQVEGRKMAKSEGNFVTINELLNTKNFGGRGWHRGVVRYAMLMTHYREPIDWSTNSLMQARRELALFAHTMRDLMGSNDIALDGEPDAELLAHLSNDLDTPSALARLVRLRNKAKTLEEKQYLARSAKFLNLIEPGEAEIYDEGYLFSLEVERPADINAMVEQKRVAEANNSVSLSEDVDQRLSAKGLQAIIIKPGLYSIKAKGANFDIEEFEARINRERDRRLTFIRDKNWKEADRLREELLAQGIQLKDGKDPATGERITTWEVKR